jgi:hypothetical protein
MILDSIADFRLKEKHKGRKADWRDDSAVGAVPRGQGDSLDVTPRGKFQEQKR